MIPGLRSLVMFKVTQLDPRIGSFSRGNGESACKSRDYIFVTSVKLALGPQVQGIVSVNGPTSPTVAVSPYFARKQAQKFALQFPFSLA